jgi:hypothetical protein
MNDRAKGQFDSLPTTAELGGEGGSYGDSASRQSRENPAEGPDRVRDERDEAVTDMLGHVTRLPDVPTDADAPTVRDELKKHPSE